MQGRKIAGFRLCTGLQGLVGQHGVLAAVAGVVAEAPHFQPVTPGGKPMSIRMTAAGRLGRIADRPGYRYAAHHPAGQVWPAVPEAVLSQSCRINLTLRVAEL